MMEALDATDAGSSPPLPANWLAIAQFAVAAAIGPLLAQSASFNACIQNKMMNW
jgi:hypothetical protein